MITGIIENNKDPEKRGRVQVRLFGIHTYDKDVLPTEDLLWSYIAKATTESNFGKGVLSIPEQGTMVAGEFLDKYKQIFIVTHVLPIDYDELPDFTKGFSDMDAKNPSDDTLKDFPEETEETQVKDFPEEPDMDFTTIYPKRRYFYRDVKGNKIYIDTTDNNNVIRIHHNSGTEIQIDNNGKIIIKAKDELYISSKDEITVNSSNDINVKSNGNVNVTGNTINLN